MSEVRPRAAPRLLRLASVAESPAGALVLWAVLTAIVQRWASWEEGVRVQFAADSRYYESMARAAPSLPSEHVLRPYAERFPTHWLVGTVSDVTDIGLHDVYRVASVLCIALVLWSVHRALLRLDLAGGTYALCLGAVAASAYPVHYLLAAPGMVADGVCLLGLAVLMLGFTSVSPSLVLAGLVIGTIGRQTMVPAGVAAAVWIAFAPEWRPRRLPLAAACVVVPGVLYGVLHIVASSFSTARDLGVHELTLIGFLDSPRDFAEHAGRVVLGLAVPAALVLGGWARARRNPVSGPLLVAVAVALQPLALGPSANGSNEPRLAGLAAPALAVAAAIVLRTTRLTRAETAVAAVAIAVGGLHQRYTHVGVPSNVVWATLELAAAAVVFLVLARPQLRRRAVPV